MSNKLSNTVTEQFYNKENKIAYLENTGLDITTQRTYATCFVKIAEYEKFIEKDLCEFNPKEVMDLFARESTASPASLRTDFSVCKNYTSWMIESVFEKTAINPFDKLNFIKDILPMLDIEKLKKQYITEEQLWDIANQSRNLQDSVPMLLRFYCVGGNRNSELLNLKDEDVNTINNTVTLTNDDGSTRTVSLDPRLIELIKKASDEDTYKKIFNENSKSNTIPLVDNNYVFRPIVGRRENWAFEKPTSQIICCRVKKLLASTGYEELSINRVYLSGKLHLLKKIQQCNGKIQIEDYKKVQKAFNDSIVNYDNLKKAYEIWRADEQIIAEGQVVSEEQGLELFLDEIDESYFNGNEGHDMYEGTKKQIDINVYMRSKRAKNICISHFGAKCCICGFDFKEKYGEIGNNLIHVHHLKQLSEDGKNHKVNPIEDLRPVCPNCHLILHKNKKNEPFTIEQVKKMISENKKD